MESGFIVIINNSVIKRKNTLDILHVIINNTPISRPEISKFTNLTTVTVGTVINELLESGIIMEEGQSESVGGRRAILYKFNKLAFYILGVNIRVDKIHIVLYDLAGNVLENGESVFFSSGVESVMTAILQSIMQLINNSGVQKNKIAGIAVSVPGRVDFEKGIINQITNVIEWKQVPLKDYLEHMTGIPTYVERDAHCCLMYLKWNGFIKNNSACAFCSIDEGIGASVILNNNIYHGEHGLAGELGHVTVDVQGELCNCGNTGCLETKVSNHAIIRRYKTLCAQTGVHYTDLFGNETKPIQETELVEAMIRLALQGDNNALESFRESARYLEIGLRNIINMYDVSQIIIECKWLKKLDMIFDEMVSRVFATFSMLDRSDVMITQNPVESIFDLSTYPVVLDQLFSNYNDNILI